jgi:hypothetical protein
MKTAKLRERGEREREGGRERTIKGAFNQASNQF